MNKIPELLKFYTSKDELEISFKIKDKISLKDFISFVVNRFKEYANKKKVSKFITTSYPNGLRIRKNLDTGETETMIKKRKTNPITLSDGIRIRLSSEEKLSSSEEKLSPSEEKEKEEEKKYVREFSRFSIPIDNRWVLDISVFEDTTIEVEMEYTGVTPPSSKNIEDKVNLLRNMLTTFGVFMNVDFKQKLDYVYSVYKNIKDFKNKNDSIKGIGPVITLKPHTWRELVLNPSNILITDKIDGTRKIIYSDGSFIYILNNETDFEYYNHALGFEFIIDVEEYVTPDTGKKIYYPFDIYLYRKTRFIGKPFTYRLDHIHKLLGELHSSKKEKNSVHKQEKNPVRIVQKTFMGLPEKKYEEYLREFINSPKPYNTDGFIIIDNKNNTSYKYKQENTIDFYLVKHPELSTNTYVLNCTIDEFTFKRLALPESLRDPKYDGDKTFPIPFMSSLNTSVDISLYTFDSDEDHSEKIGEFNYNRKTGSWDFLKFRTDRVVSSSYYGNYYNVAETNFAMSMIDFDITENLGYFSSSNKKEQENIRKYTNHVMKQYLFDRIHEKIESNTSESNNTYIKKRNILKNKEETFVVKTESKHRLLDISCGRGQDLNRYERRNTELVLGIDIDKNAIVEMIDRRLGGGRSPYGKKTMTHPYLLLAAISDVTRPYKENLSLLEQNFSIEKGYFTHSVCMLAFHYFCDNAKTLNNCLKFVSESLVTGGKFGMILFDGYKIVSLMLDAKKNTKFKFGNEMCLRKEHDSYELYGTKIGVKLPFSNSNFYTENVVVIDDLLEEFRKNDLYLVEKIPFEKFFDNHKVKITDLDEKNYLSLYHCVIFEKR